MSVANRLGLIALIFILGVWYAYLIRNSDHFTPIWHWISIGVGIVIIVLVLISFEVIRGM
ncbi:hypothetical protein IV38_GL001183 [Lactobacillus selangorensis]|uniref:Uncharacterized protein n=1 Tax=Lactobacillus selangorensis TaxID=81857 RepID=A0A0R2G5W4_9LACO|nr:hypothetical protein [Lactobacillus selangorensis]KRN28970.1 hypothetical protein IV38_GL001183 [Lactobacillus selangorensis]KRN32620.1 hypothetical protein IV40_GL000670 [Lactobacillus selangorensis]